MSLLNEALRKNRSEQDRQVIYAAPSQEAINSKRVLLYIVLFLVLAAGFSYMWIRENHKLSVSSETQNGPVNSITSSIPGPVAPSVKVDTETKETAFNVTKEAEIIIPEKEIQAAPDKVTTSVSASNEKVQEAEVAIDRGRVEIHTEQPENEEYFLRKAVQLHREAKPEAALMMYKKASALNPSNSEALFNMASIYITMARYQDAYEILSALIKMDEADTKTMLNLAVAEIGLEKYSDALLHLDNPGVPDPGLLFEISFHRGVALSRIGRPDDAIKSYKGAEKINSNNPALLLNMAVLYDRYGRYSEAVDYYTKLINSDSSRSVEMGVYKNRIKQLSAHLHGSSENGFGKE
ncbi:MAG: tetratricopeptide repeat protein [Deltaproteobacteria bacterium]|nr:tetratricopeptide repeat protein [Deltaproteobacteria bacterium]